MSASSLPNELLTKILAYLQNDDLNRARHVCVRWNEIGEQLNDSYWKARCQKDFPEESEDAFSKSNLEWQELHQSLSLWPNVAEANITCYETDEDVFSQYHVEREHSNRFYPLKDGYIAVAGYSYEDKREHRMSEMEGKYNRIVYYSVDNLQERNSKHFDFTFDRHYENDDIVVLRKTNGTLHVVVKGEDENIGADVGKLGRNTCYKGSEFHVLNNDVYFMNYKQMLCVAMIYFEVEDGVPVRKVKAEELLKPNFQDRIVAMAYISPNQVNILDEIGCIYSLKDNHLECIRILKRMVKRTIMVNALKQYGFDWANEDVYNNWLKTTDSIEDDWVAISRVKNAIIHRQGKLVLVATTLKRSCIHVYYNPYRANGDLNLYNAKPLLKIELSDILPVADKPGEWYRHKLIEQMSVVEATNGHRIVVLYANRLAVVHLDHGTPKRPHPQVWRTNNYETRRSAKSLWTFVKELDNLVGDPNHPAPAGNRS